MSPVATVPIDLAQLRRGDLLLYGGGGIFNLVIQTKTWSHFSHVEVFDGRGLDGVPYALASRNNIGVNRYLLRTDGLRLVLRPMLDLDFEAGARWFETEARFQPYDWWGLLAFSSAKWQGRENGKMFCSEFAARYLRVCIASAYNVELGDDLRQRLAEVNLDPWNGTDADALSPAQCPMSPFLPKVMAAKETYL